MQAKRLHLVEDDLTRGTHTWVAELHSNGHPQRERIAMNISIHAVEHLDHRAAMRELDARHNDGIAVRLLWHPETDELLVTAYDTRTGEQLDMPVSPEDAASAFRHPFTTAA